MPDESGAKSLNVLKSRNPLGAGYELDASLQFSHHPVFRLDFPIRFVSLILINLFHIRLISHNVGSTFLITIFTVHYSILFHLTLKTRLVMVTST